VPRKLKIGCDKDNVIARCAERFCEILEEKYSICLPVGEVNHYFFQDNHPGITEEMVEDIIKNDLVKEEQINMVTVREGIECLLSLKNKTDLWIITSTFNYGTEQEDVEEWCRRNGLNQCSVIISSKKEKWVKELELDFMIEDCGEFALKIARECPSCRVLLLNRPWNRYITTASFPNLQRCNDWYEINNILHASLF